MFIRACPRCHASKLQMRGSFVELQPLPIWLHQQAVVIMAITLGLIGGLLASLIPLIPGAPALPPFLPWLFIALAAGGGGLWYKLRLRYGYMLYRVQCLTCGYQWAAPERE